MAHASSFCRGTWSSNWTIPAIGGRQSGWGDLLGGVVIVMRRVETGEYHSGEVPLELFQGPVFKEQLYLEKALEIALEGMERLQITKGEPLHVCSGYILSKIRDELQAEGYEIVTVKITGLTQDLAEREFKRSLVRRGVGDEWTVSEMRSFDAYLGWVMEDLDGRERLVKTGWKAWPHLKKSRDS
jgi:hypothetical protein